MAQKRDILISAGIVALAAIFIQLMMGDSFLSIERRWFIFIGLGISGFLVFLSIKDKEMFLLRITIFLLPYQLGFVYTAAIDQDLIFAFDVGLFALYFYWMIDTHGFQAYSFYWPKSVLPAALFIAWSCTSLPFSITPLSSGIGIFTNLKGFLIFFYIINRINDKSKLMVLFNFLIVVLAVEGLLSVLQKFLILDVDLQFLGIASQSYIQDMSRVGGTFLLPNLFGGFMACLVPLSISYFMFTVKLPKRTLLVIISVLGLLGLFWSLSRSAWVGIIGGVLVMGFLMMKNIRKNPGRFRTLIVVFIIMLVIIIVFYDIILRRWETGATLEGRIEIMKIALKIIAKNPITGVGLRNYEYHSYPLYRFWRPVHNEYLRLCAEVGVPGVTFFLWFLFLTVKNAMRGFRIKDRLLNMVALAVVGSFTSFFIFVMFGPEYQHYRLKILVWILAGMGTAILRIRRLDLARNQSTEVKQEKAVEELSR